MVLGFVLVVLGWGPPGGRMGSGGGFDSPLAAFLPPWATALMGIGGFGLVVFGLFLDGLPTSPDDRTWVPDEEEMDEWESDAER